MKLRLVREDGTPATLDDLVGGRMADSIEIDGVRCFVSEYEGTDGGDKPWRAADAAGTLRLVLTYGNQTRVATYSKNGRAHSRYEYDCAFARRRRARERAGR